MKLPNMVGESKPIFKDGVFAIIISRDIPRIQAEEVYSAIATVCERTVD